jgi:hypothetical protein
MACIRKSFRSGMPKAARRQLSGVGIAATGSPATSRTRPCLDSCRPRASGRPDGARTAPPRPVPVAEEQRWPSPRGVRRTEDRVAVDHPVVAGGVLVEERCVWPAPRSARGPRHRRRQPTRPGAAATATPACTAPVEDEGEAHVLPAPPSGAAAARRRRSRWIG